MFKHLFKLIWNKKKQNFLLMSEMFFSFLVLFAVFTLLVFYYQNYKKPMGFDYKDVWVVSYNNSLKTKNTDSVNAYYETMRKNITAMPEVNDISFCSDNIPFSSNHWTEGVTYKKVETEGVNWFTVDANYKNTLNVKLLEGRWFEKSDVVSKYKPVLINSDLKEKLFGAEPGTGKILDRGDKGKDKVKVIGVIQSLKLRGDYDKPAIALYNLADTGSYHWLGKIMIKVSPTTANAAFEARLYKLLANYMKDSNVEIEHMVNKRTEVNYFTLVPMIVLLTVGGFLVINVALGLFGVLWYNINKRRGEIGLRRAVGATGSSVSNQLITESMILATLSLIIGTFFAVQFPLLNVFDMPAGIYLTAILLSIIFIYLLVFLCSLYPGKQAAAIYPAVALHEE